MKKLKRALSPSRQLKLIDKESRSCASLHHSDNGNSESVKGYLLNKQFNSAMLDILTKHGDLHFDSVKKLSKIRNIFICRECLNEARSVKDKVYMHLYALSEKLDAVDN